MKTHLNRWERVARLRRAEALLASGVDIVIPEEWRENSGPIEIMVGPPDQCLAWNDSVGSTYYSVYLQIFAKQSGLTYPEFDLRAPWDGGIMLQRIELTKKKGVGFKPVIDFKQHFYFGGQRYWGEEILNPRVESEERLPPHQIIDGYCLATGARHIPPRYRDMTLVPFDLIVRDQFSGEIMQTLRADFVVSRLYQAKRRTRVAHGGLYAGEPLPVPLAEESRIRKPKVSLLFSAPVTAEQRHDQILERAAILRMEKEVDAMMRREENAWRKRQRNSRYDCGLPWSALSKHIQPSRIEPNPSFPRRIEVDENLVVVSMSDKSGVENQDASD